MFHILVIGKALKVLIYGEDEDGNEEDETMDDSKMDTSIVEESEKGTVNITVYASGPCIIIVYYFLCTIA